VNILYPSMFFGLEHIAEDSTTSAINNIYLNGVRVAAMAENGALAYYLTDQVDSVSHVLDDAAETLTRIQYKPYGETFVHKGDQDFAPKYNSQELDPESKLYYYNARYYDPQVARFTSPDTVLDGGAFYTQAWNRYMYVRGNPIRYKDPTGHEAATCGQNCNIGSGLGDLFKSWFGGNPKSAETDSISPSNEMTVEKAGSTRGIGSAYQ
jgi:RHS repeat-associated protein